MTKEEFKKLQQGDLVEWRPWPRSVKPENKLGIVMATYNFKNTLYSARIKWNSYEDTSVYTHDAEAVRQWALIAKAKKTK